MLKLTEGQNENKNFYLSPRGRKDKSEVSKK
jgi:hypothetical protein